MGQTIGAHAQVRLQQRGISADDARLLTEYGSRLVHHKGCELVTLGRDGRRELAAEGVSCQRIERLKRLAVVLGADKATVVTALQPQGRRGRRYFQAN